MSEPAPADRYAESMPTSHTTRNVVLVVVGAAMFIGACLAAVVLISDDAPHARVTSTRYQAEVPTSVAGYSRQTGPTASRPATALQQQITKQGDGLQHARVAAFGRDGSSVPTFFLIIYSGRNGDKLRSDLQAGRSSAYVDAFLQGGGMRRTSDFDAGPLGGVLRCGSGGAPTDPPVGCVWADQWTFGALVWAQPESVSDAAALALQVRTTAER